MVKKKKAISFFENCSFLCGSISLMYVFLVIAARNHTNYDHHIPFVVDTMECWSLYRTVLFGIGVMVEHRLKKLMWMC